MFRTLSPMMTTLVLGLAAISALTIRPMEECTAPQRPRSDEQAMMSCPFSPSSSEVGGKQHLNHFKHVLTFVFN